MKKLVIVESPHKAHLIQGFLGDEYIVLSSKGHITELAKGGNFGLGVDIENNFKPRYILSDDKISVLNEILNAAKHSEIIYLCSDPDREGEAIAWHISQRLDGIDKPIKRAEFSEIKKSVVLKSLKNSRDIDLNLFHSQEARRILDRIVGFTASPFLINFFGSGLSAGRVQSVVTRMIVDREREIEAFVPEEFWTIQANVSKDNKNAFIAKYSGRPTNENYATDIFNQISDKNSKFIVFDVISKEEPKYAPPPLITSTLQRIMSKKHSFNAERTMKAAQSLYENGYCTYIRTDSVRAGDEAIDEVRNWLTSNNYSIPIKPFIYKNGDAAQDAHECIRPVDISLLPDNNMAIIDPDEKLVYETIWQYFVASQMNPAIYNTLKVSLKLESNNSIILKSSGKAIKSNGFLDIFGSVDAGKIDIPNLVNGDIIYLFGKKAVKLERKQTQPPPRYSEDKLIEELDHKGIGRPATYADLLSKICNRNYVEKHGNVYYPTELGKKITDVLTKQFTFMEYDYTASMEKKLDYIERGKEDHIEMLRKFYDQFKNEISKAYSDNGGTLCEKCGKPMVVKIAKKTNEKFLGCSGYPNCKSLKSIEQQI